MTDLPRFHKGQLGPINFQTLNEVMRRLDALRPLIETASIQAEAESGMMPDALIVYAEQTHPVEYPGRLAWHQVVVRGESTPSIPLTGDPDTVATQEDEDWPDIEENAQFRRGYVVKETEKKDGTPETVEAESYAISLDPSFSEGYGILFSIRRTDARRCFFLLPILSIEGGAGGTVTNLVRVSEFLGESLIAGNDGSTIRANRYSCRSIAIGPGGDSFTASTSDYLLLDFGQSPNVDINRPTVLPEGAALFPRTLDPGSIVLARRVSDEGIYVSSTLTHYDVDCG